jgi:hypothetical protein
MTTIPESVIETDHKLEAAAERSSEKLAKHRWHQTLDPEGPQHSLRAYAKAVGRNVHTISVYANGYAAWSVASGATLQDCIRLAGMSAEKAEVAEAVAEVEGVSVSTVAGRRGTSDSLANVTEMAKERAEKNGTTIAAEAKAIAERREAMKRSDAKDKKAKANRTGLRFLDVETLLKAATRKVKEANGIAADVGFDAEHIELLADDVRTLKAAIDELYLTLGGEFDWDAGLREVLK